MNIEFDGVLSAVASVIYPGEAVALCGFSDGALLALHLPKPVWRQAESAFAAAMLNDYSDKGRARSLSLHGIASVDWAKSGDLDRMRFVTSSGEYASFYVKGGAGEDFARGINAAIAQIVASDGEPTKA